MGKKPDYQLEYVYTKKAFKKQMWILVLIWLALRITRLTLYMIFGVAYLGTVAASLIFWGTGLCFGLAIMSIIVYRRSVPLEQIEAERARLQQ